MNNNQQISENRILKPTTDEQPTSIVAGIIIFYVLIAVFIFYLYFLHRISLVVAVVSVLVFTVIYLPRFFILKKLKDKDIIEITDRHIVINGEPVQFAEIVDFRVTREKPQVVFFLSNKMVVFQQARFDLKLENGVKSFIAIGTEKINLLNEFFENIFLH